MKISATCFLLNLTILTSPILAVAAESLTWSGSLATEREYDSSVSLDQVDDVSRESDYSSQLKWALGGKWQAHKNWQLAANYQGRQRAYDQFSEYDLEQHHLTLSSKVTFSGVGYSYRHDGVTAQIDGDDFLNFSQSTVAIDKVFDSSFFLRAALSKNTKDFIQVEERNATATVIGLDSLAFFNRGKSHVGFNVSVENEIADASEYDNKTGNVSMAYQHKFTEAYLPTTFTSSISYGRKHYDSFVIATQIAEETFPVGLPADATSDNETRVDGRTQWTTSLDIALNDWLGLMLKATYINNDSNYAAVDYNERQMSAGISASF
jgi:hypothetical protein